jgi:hypothetical protein
MQIIKEQFKSASSPSVHTASFDPASKTAKCTCRGAKPPNNGCWHMEYMLLVHAGVEPSPKNRSKVMAAVDEKGPCDAAKAAAAVDRKPTVTPRLYDPMLASAMTKGQRIEDFGDPAKWVGEVKYNGERRLLRVSSAGVVVRSRSGKTDDLPEHIRRAAGQLPFGVYDGELVDLTARHQRSGNSRRGDKKDVLTLVLFDVLEVFDQVVVQEPYHARRELLRLAVAHYEKASHGGRIILQSLEVPVTAAAFKAVTDNGGEGLVVKAKYSKYRPGYRSEEWVKFVKLVTFGAVVTGFVAGDTGIECGKTVLRDDDGRVVEVKTKNNQIIAEARRGLHVGRRAVIAARELMPESNKWLMPRFDHWAGKGE